MCLVEKAKSMHKDVVARTMIENKSSIRVMEKAGLKFVEEFWWGDCNPHSGNPDVLYKTHSNEWVSFFVDLTVLEFRLFDIFVV